MCSGRSGPMRRRASRTASRVAASQSSQVDLGQRRPAPCHAPGRRMPMAMKPRSLVALGDVAQAVGRIGQPVQEDHGAARRAVGLQQEAAVPVLHEAVGMHRAAGEVAVGEDPVLRLQRVRHLAPHRLEGGLLDLDVARPVGGIERRDRQFLRHHQVPGASGGALDRPRCAGPAARHDQQRRAGWRHGGAGVWSGAACASCPAIWLALP